MTQLKEYSPQANLFILIHKMDKIRDSEKITKYEAKKEGILKEFEAFKDSVKLRAMFGTSIWDETLYQAWSQIVQMLIP